MKKKRKKNEKLKKKINEKMEKVRKKNGGNPNFRVNETLKDHRNYDTNKTKRKISE
jgi:hypothetical protein